MLTVYSRTTKIKDAVGRSAYISGASGKQEEVVLHVCSMKYSWQFHADYEKEHEHNAGQKQNNAREIVVALPNGLANPVKDATTAEQKERIKAICDDIADTVVGKEYDYEYACHWNTARTNFHMHLMFSERASKEEVVKRYKKDIWQDQKTGRLAKAGSEGAVLAHRKGDIQYDKEGNIKYDSSPLGPKDKRFVQHSFMAVRDKQIQEVLSEYGYDVSIQDESTPYLSQRKIFKTSNEEFKQAVTEYNSAVKDYNHAVKQHLELEPEKVEHYRQVRDDVEREVRSANHMEKKISCRAIEAVHQMTEKVKEFIRLASAKIKTDVLGWWEKSKDVMLQAFRDQLDDSKRKETINYGTGKGFARNDNLTKSSVTENIRVGKREYGVNRADTAKRIATLRDAVLGRRDEIQNGNTPKGEHHTQTFA